MRVIGQNQRFASLLWILVLILAGSSFAHGQVRRRPTFPPQPNTPTADQEAQPNTSQYPQRPGFTPGNPYNQPSIPIPQTAPAATAQPAPQSNPAPQASQTQPTLVPAPPQGFIGPPVPMPPTPEQMPPGPPKITYQNGLLSVESVNSRLSDILNGIHNRTGIQFEGLLPGQDRVAGKFGPAPADEVLSTLLRGSRYDYVILGVPENPQLVQRVILTPNSTSGTVAGATSNAGARPQGTDEEEENGSEEAEGQQQEQVQAPEQPQQVQPIQQPGQNGQNANNTPKTTEQLLEELKQMQQRNQQRQPPTAPIKPTAPQ